MDPYTLFGILGAFLGGGVFGFACAAAFFIQALTRAHNAMFDAGLEIDRVTKELRAMTAKARETV